MKKTTAIASFLFLATLAGGAQAAPMVATKAYVEDGLEKKQNTLTAGANIQLSSQSNGTVEISANLDSVTMHAGTGITIDDNNTIRANYETLQFTLTDSNAAANLESGAARISAIKQYNGLLGVLTSDWGQVAENEVAPASGGDVYNAIRDAVTGLQPTITGIGDIVVNNNQVSVTYNSLGYDSTSDTAVTGLADGSKRIKTVLQTNGKVGVTVTDWGEVAENEAAPASGGDVYAAIQNAVQNLYTAGDGISIADNEIAAKGDTNRNIEVSTDGIGISMDGFDTTADITGSGYGAGLLEGISRVARIEQNDKGEITVKTDKWNEMWSEVNEPIRTGKIKDALDLKIDEIIPGSYISVSETSTSPDGYPDDPNINKVTISSTLRAGNGIQFTPGIGNGLTYVGLGLTATTATRLIDSDGNLSLSGLSYSSIDDENAAGLANGTSRIASITQSEGVISVRTGSWVESLTELDEGEYGVPATAQAIVAAITPVEQTANEAAETANDALQAANDAAAVATQALEAANNAIPKPDPDECGSHENRCVLTYGLNDAGVLAFEWEVITRATGEQEQ